MRLLCRGLHKPDPRAPTLSARARLLAATERGRLRLCRKGRLRLCGRVCYACAGEVHCACDAGV